MKIVKLSKSKYRKAKWYEEYDTLCSSVLAVILMAVFMAAIFI